LSKIALSGNASGSGTLTIAAPNTNTDRTLTLPDNTGTMMLTNTAVAKSQLPAGSVLQVVQATTGTSFSTTSTTYVHATNHSLSITTIAANSKILLICNTPLQVPKGTRAAAAFRSSVDSYVGNLGVITSVSETESVADGWKQFSTLQYLHSPSQPASTSITYRVYVRRATGSVSIYYPDAWGLDPEFSFIAMEIAA